MRCSRSPLENQMPCRTAILVLAVLAAASAGERQPPPRPPVIDVHVHSTTTHPGDVDRLRARNVRYWFLAGLTSDLRDWASVDASRFLAALVFPCDRGRAPITGRACYDTATDFPDIAWLRAELRAGRIKGFGELSPQYLGMSVADARLQLVLGPGRGIRHSSGRSLGARPQGGRIRVQQCAVQIAGIPNVIRGSAGGRGCAVTSQASPDLCHARRMAAPRSHDRTAPRPSRRSR